MTSLEACDKDLPSSNKLLLWNSTKRIKEHLKTDVKTNGGPAHAGRENFSVTIKADSHIACRAHATSMLFTCHAVPLRVWNASCSQTSHIIHTPAQRKQSIINRALTLYIFVGRCDLRVESWDCSYWIVHAGTMGV
jgi:hypothetical protein